MKPERVVIIALVLASSIVPAVAQTVLPDPIFKDSFEAPPTCGNGVVESGEDCDGSDFSSASCETLGFASGTLACTPSCSFDTSGCSNCGNGTIDPGEVCDGLDLGGATCQSQGFASGDLSCAASCASFDTSSCVPESISCDWAGARWLSHGFDGGHSTSTGAWFSCINSRVSYVDLVHNNPPGFGATPFPSGTSDSLVGCNWSSTRWASEGLDGSAAFTSGARIGCDGTRVTAMAWENTTVPGGVVREGNLDCDWSGAIFLTHGKDSTCAFQTGFNVTCSNNKITNFVWVSSPSCPAQRN